MRSTAEILGDHLKCFAALGVPDDGESAYGVAEPQPEALASPVGADTREVFFELRLISVKRSAGDQIENWMDFIARMTCSKTALYLRSTVVSPNWTSRVRFRGITVSQFSGIEGTGFFD